VGGLVRGCCAQDRAESWLPRGKVAWTLAFCVRGGASSWLRGLNTKLQRRVVHHFRTMTQPTYIVLPASIVSRTRCCGHKEAMMQTSSDPAELYCLFSPTSDNDKEEWEHFKVKSYANNSPV
jgi:hypothetical protein